MKEQKQQPKTAKDFELTALYMNKQYLVDNEEIEKKLAATMLHFPATHAKLFARVSPAMFAYEFPRTLFQAGETLYRQNKEINIMTVWEELKRTDMEDGDNLLFFNMSQLKMDYMDDYYLNEHIAILYSYYTRRQTFLLLGNMTQKIQALTEDPLDVLRETIDLSTRLIAATGGTDRLKDMPQIMETVFRALQARMDQNGQGITGVDMGVPAMNELLLGWQPGYLYVMAACTGMGKTALMLYAALAAARQGKHILIISLEMSGLHLGDRLMSMVSDIPPTDWAKGTITPEQMEAAEAARAVLEKIEIRIDDSGAITMPEIAMIAKSLNAQGKCDMVFIDYLQLFRAEQQAYGGTREQEVARNSRMAKQIAMQLNIPVVMLSQFNREVYNQKEQRPTLANLRESGSIEQDADVVMLLHRPAKADIPTDKKTGYPTDGLLINIVAKNRNGRTEDLYMAHSPAMNHFEDYEPPTEWIKKLKGGIAKSQYDLFMERKGETESADL